jgi:hypothetical protein
MRRREAPGGVGKRQRCRRLPVSHTGGRGPLNPKFDSCGCATNFRCGPPLARSEPGDRDAHVVLRVTVSRKDGRVLYRRRMLDPSSSQGRDAMLAEIFMLRLETAARGLRDSLPLSASQFVSYTPNSRFTFNASRKYSEALPEPPTTQELQ